MIRGCNVVFFTNMLNLKLSRKLIFSNKSKFIAILLILNLLRCDFFKLRNHTKFVYYYLYWRFLKFSNLYSAQMLYIAHTKNYFISDFLRFKLKCFKPSTFLNLKLFFDINPRPCLLGYSYSLVHLFYSLKNRKLNTSFMEINLISDNKSPVIYYQIQHGTKLKNRRKNRVEIINYNINYNVKLGRDTPGERGSYVLKKTLLHKNSLPLKRKRVFFFKRIWEKFELGSRFNPRFIINNFIGSYNYLHSCCYSFNYSLVISDYNNYVSYHSLPKTYFDSSNYKFYSHGHSLNYHIKDTKRLVLTFLNLIVDRVNIGGHWTFIFDSNNTISNCYHIFTYFFEYWIIRNLAKSNLKIWFKFIGDFAKKRNKLKRPSMLLNDVPRSWNIETLAPLLNCAPIMTFSDLNRKLVVKKLNIFKSKTIFWLFNKYVISILQSFMKKRIIFSIKKNVYRALENKIYNDAYYSMQNPNLLFKRIYFAEEFINILITLAFSKDPVPFANWLAKNMGETDFWKHWAFIAYVRFSIRDMFAVLQSAYGLRGLRIKFKGKIGNKGSFRKKKIILRYGGIKKSNVLSRADEAFGLAKNFTGVIGITVTLAY